MKSTRVAVIWGETEKVRVLKWRSPLKPPYVMERCGIPLGFGVGWLFCATGPRRPATSVVSSYEESVGIPWGLECLPGSENAKRIVSNFANLWMSWKKSCGQLLHFIIKSNSSPWKMWLWMITGDTWRLEIDSPCFPTLLKPQPSERHGTKSRDNRRQRAISCLSSTFQSWSSPSATSENIWSILIKSDQRANWPHFLLRILWSLGQTPRWVIRSSWCRGDWT